MTQENRLDIDDETAPEAAALLAGAEPADALESMLVKQMAAVHDAALRAVARAAECQDNPQVEALYLRQAARLMHLFVRQAEALDRRRAAAEDRDMARVWEAERKARVEASERREAEERARVLRRYIPDPPRRRNRSGGPDAGNGTRKPAAPPP